MRIQPIGLARRYKSEAGLAIGPIFFILVILGILAAAIVAGTDAFTSDLSEPSNANKATELLQIGANLKNGMDRMLLRNRLPFNNIVIDTTKTSNSFDLFSPTGGGVTPPSVLMSQDPKSDQWYFVLAIIPGLGTGASSALPDELAMIEVSEGVCDVVNLRVSKLNTKIAHYDSAAIGDVENSKNNLGNLLNVGAWPEALKGKPVGCLYNTTTHTHWFYQVLAIQ